MRVTPGIYFGYTIGKGLNAGIDCSVSFFNYSLSDDISGYSGLNISYAVFYHEKKLYKNGFYRSVAVNIVNTMNNVVITKLGLAKTKLKWGLNNVNKSYSKGWGLNLDIAVAPLKTAPVAGFRYFYTNNPCLRMGANNPAFLYIGYQQPFLIKIQKAGNKL